MSQLPSIKGSVFSHSVEKLRKLVASGKISQEELSKRLEPDDIKIIEGPIHATGWYDIRVYERIVLLNADAEGDGSNDRLIQYGAKSAERLLQGGIYQQLDYLTRVQVNKASDSEARFQAFGRDLRLLTTLNASIWNFGSIEVKVDPEHDDRYVIEYFDAHLYPELMFWVTQGFMNRLAVEHGEPDLWRWERTAPDRVVYRMTRAL